MALDINSDPTDVSLSGLYGGGGDMGSSMAGTDASDYFKRQDSPMSQDQYLASLKGVGAGMADQPNAKWMQQSPETNPNFYANLYELLGANGSRSGVDWSKLGYTGPGVTETGNGYRDSGGDYVTPSSPWNVPDSWKQFVDTNKLGLNLGQNDQGFQLSQLTRNGQLVPGANYSYATPNDDAFNVMQAIVAAGMGYGVGAAAGAGGAAAGGGAASGTATGTAADASLGAGFDFGAGSGATFGGGTGGATLAGADALGAGIGGVNAGVGGGFSLAGLGQSAGRGALVNGGSTALQGGDLKDILKSAGTGAIGGGLGYGVGYTNPGSYLTDNPNYQSIVNRGVTGGLNAGVSGGNVGMGALWGAGQQAGNVAGNATWNSFNSPSGGGGTVPDYYTGGMFDAQPGGIDAFAQQDQPSPYWSMDQSTYGGNYNSELPMGGDYTSGYTASNGTDEQTTKGSPVQDLMSRILGVSNGNAGGGASPKFGDMAGSLLGMYQAYQQKKKYGQLAGNLSSMYGPNSPYAQQLQQQLMRRDAAAGRRSQYGPREVELQARLADVNSRMAPTLQSLYGAQGQQGNALLNNGLRFGQQSGLLGSLGSYVGQQAMPWINSMFNQTPANSGPQLEG